MRRSKYITPSILNVEKEARPKVVQELLDLGITWVHYDVMDGDFVPNTAIEYEEIKNIKSTVDKHFMDIHLMVRNPIANIIEFADAGDIMTVHYEAVEDKDYFFNWLQDNEANYKIGLAINPETEVKSIKRFLPFLSLVLVMSVKPGAGGQAFIPSALSKIEWLKEQRLVNQFSYLIQVDGGINDETGPMCFDAGVDAAVAGSYLVKEITTERIKSILGSKYKLK
ncbi:ribulose-phosphate 3-epimerase [Mycoplasma sp. Ms02]|uniref:ribulose-phosphate 3-epimerase n=1 Tax=Mycoplasma sp. Ms02 TaxID=353851 RepID=UPI001C8A2843|nr:ribulose-phosphate 3-epimerase [Mycoplasma sp. Ms02]QZE12637.1 ribulose-phosphate 3-epimerase [Mycoplasma sp. Ms02]